LAGRYLCLFVFLIPFSGFAIGGSEVPDNDTILYHTSSQIYIAEGAILHNGQKVHTSENTVRAIEKLEPARIYIVKGTGVSGLQEDSGITIAYLEPLAKEGRHYAKNHLLPEKRPKAISVPTRETSHISSGKTIHAENSRHCLLRAFADHNFAIYPPVGQNIKAITVSPLAEVHPAYYHITENTTGHWSFSRFLIYLTTGGIRPPPIA
jgi:hypothetical protein